MLNLKTLINFLNPRARNDDPQTSKDAGRSSFNFSSRHIDQIIETLLQYGPMGKDNIAAITGLEKSSVARRMKEIQKTGIISLTGRTVNSSSGRKEREWSITKVENA